MGHLIGSLYILDSEKIIMNKHNHTVIKQKKLPCSCQVVPQGFLPTVCDCSLATKGLVTQTEYSLKDNYI